jgi:catalase
MKLLTGDGNQDFIFKDLPVSFIREPYQIPTMNQSHKRHPRANVLDVTKLISDGSFRYIKVPLEARSWHPNPVI